MKEWIRPYKYGPRLVGLAVPKDLYDLAQQKIQNKKAKDAERENKRTEKLRREIEAELPQAKEYVKWKWPELTEEQYERFFTEFYTFEQIRSKYEDEETMEDICAARIRVSC